MKINIKIISDYLINIGIILCLYSLLVVYISKKSMPSGTCPIDENNNLLYISIFISLLGLILSFISDRKK